MAKMKGMAPMVPGLAPMPPIQRRATRKAKDFMRAGRKRKGMKMKIAPEG